MEKAKRSSVALTFIHFIVRHDGNTFFPDHLDVCPVAVTSPQEHGKEN